MDFSPLRKSFKSQGSYNKNGARKLSIGGGGANGDEASHEELPILSTHHPDVDTHGFRHDDSRPEVIVKVDGGNYGVGDSSSDGVSSVGGNVQRELRFGAMKHGKQPAVAATTEDPPSRLIGQFLKKQKEEGGEIALDMDIEMNELVHENPSPPPPLPTKPSSREVRVSFDPSISGGIDIISSESIRRRYKDSPENNESNNNNKCVTSRRDNEVLRCTSNASLQSQASRLSRLKTKSRLLDPPPEEIERASTAKTAKSGQLPRSGMLLSRVLDDEEEDPLDDNDVPDEFKRGNLNTLTLLQWLSLIAIVGALICSLCIPALKHLHFLKLQLWKWEVLLLVLICGRLVSGWGIRIAVFFIERNFFFRKKVLYFVYGLRKAVQNCLWLGLVLLAWHYIFDKKVERETKSDLLKYVTKILICFLVANFIWLLKTLLVKVLASSFHVSTYFDRIQEALFNQFVIETLSGPPLIEMQRNEEDLERTADEVRKLQSAGATMPPELKAAVFPPGKSGRIATVSGRVHKSFKGKSFKLSRQFSKNGEKKGGDNNNNDGNNNGIRIDHLHKLNTKNISAWNMKRLMKIVRHGSLSTLDEQILGSNSATAAEDESATQIQSEYQAKAAARTIFYNVASPHSKYICLEDVMRFMREEEALKTMDLFEGASETCKISKAALKNWVVNAFRERKALALTLNDTKTAVNKLHQMVNIMVGIIIVVIWLVILGIATSKYLVFIGSQLVIVSFVFGNTAKTLFECNIFLFIIHPFDVGDRCEIDGVQMIVEEMNILTTVFLRADNQKIVYPNSVLATKPIGNFYRSPDMGDAIEFFVHISTPTEKIAVMKQRIVSYIEGKKEHWYPSPVMVMKDVEELNKLRMAVWVRHRINHQDMGEKWHRRSVLLEEMVKIFKELDIQYRLHPLDINILTLPPP